MAESSITTLRILHDAAQAGQAVRTHCPYCAFQCGMIVKQEQGKLLVSPDPDFPVNRGQMCIKGFNSGQLSNTVDRLLQPMRRNASGFEPVSWDEALSDIADRIQKIQATHGRNAMGLFGSGALTNEKAYLLGKFARVCLRTANIDYNGRYCMASAAVGQNRAFGIDRGMPFLVSDIAQTDTALLWGSNLADTLPPIMQYFHQLKASGGKMIVVDPRLTETARQADLHLQLTPGTDLMLANGLLHIAIDENLVDRDYIHDRTNDWPAVQAIALRYHPAYVERATGVGADQMRTAVRWMAAGRSMLLSGRGPEQQSKGSDSVCAFTNLMLALGKVGKPFSGYGTLTGQGNGQGGREHGQKADQLPGYRLIEKMEDRKFMAEYWGMEESDLPGKGLSAVELIASAGQPQGIHGLMVFGSNLVVSTPDASRVREQLSSLDLLVVVDSYLNETAELADYVLPTLQFAEEQGTMTNLEGRVIRRRQVVDAPDGPRGDLQIISDLAEKLGESSRFTFPNTEAVFDELRGATRGARADYSGITYARIDAADGICWPCPEEDHPGTPRLFAERFSHADGRARFVPVEHRPSGEEPDDEYPLYFTTGRYREHYNSGVQTRRVEALNKSRPNARVQMHPLLANRLKVADGQSVLVESRRGKLILDINITPEIRPDTLFAPFHWGGKQAVNILTNPALDPISKMPEYKVCAVRASRLS